MTKYSTPSIEVLSFNSCDAPRIGMQWWVATGVNGTAWVAAPNWTPNQASLENPRENVDYSQYGVTCNNVTLYSCRNEVFEGAMVWPIANSDDTALAVLDDHIPSC